MEKVLVTGASGYIALHCIAELLKNEFAVKGSLRNMNRQEEVKNAIQKEITPDNLEFCKLDLSEDEGWDDAVWDCDYVMHVASPFPLGAPKNENDLIEPAREGTLRALRASKKGGVKRIIITSSQAAIAYGHKDMQKIFTHDDWTDINGPDVSPYVKSKTIAERAAWDFINSQEEKTLEMAVINPGAVLGPSLSSDIEGTSTDLIKKFLTKEIPAVPNIFFNVVDVRDVAKLHVAALKNPNANGKRFPAMSHDAIPMLEYAKILNTNGFPQVTTKTLPDIMVKILALFSSDMKTIKTFLNKKTKLDNSQTKDILSWEPMPIEKTFIDMGRSVQNILDQRK